MTNDGKWWMKHAVDVVYKNGETETIRCGSIVMAQRTAKQLRKKRNVAEATLQEGN